MGSPAQSFTQSHASNGIVDVVRRWNAAGTAVGVIGGIGLGIVLARQAGGTEMVPPVWMTVPTAVAAIRFSPAIAIVTALVSGGLLGGLVPADIDADLDQTVTQWASRAGFLLIEAIVLAALVDRGRTLPAAAARHHRPRRADGQIDTDDLVLHYQPIFSMTNGRIVGTEALLRWNHPRRGLLYPDEFIDLVEGDERIADWVIERAGRQTQSWRRIDPSLTLSVNVSGRVVETPNFARRTGSALDACGLPADHLCVEITETVSITDLEAAASQLRDLRASGSHVAIGDFGTGFASMTYLQRLPVDVLKIDRWFTAETTTHPGSQTIIRAVNQLAIQLDATCVVEGVETVDEASAIVAAGCDLAQGFYLSPPVPAQQLDVLFGMPRS